MKIHHLNCMSFHFGVDSITHCLLIETAKGLVLVDSGLGLTDYENPSLKMRAFKAINQVSRKVEETAFRQVSTLGYAPQDVRSIVLTHLHLDHSGGLPDFPWAEVHVSAVEHHAAFREKSLKSLIGYDSNHWSHNPRWVLHEPGNDTWFGFPAYKVSNIAGNRILLIPLYGHSQGHCGVAVEVGEKWLLHCGDAYVRDSQIDPDDPRSPFPRWAFIIERALFPKQSIKVLRSLVKNYGNQIKFFSSHDPIAFADLRNSV
jgi:glyoxylase-like metal-dependent hydrolase (beta-lactamase superfamily II)